MDKETVLTEKKFRGQKVTVEGEFVYLTIHKAQKGMFSISDKLREYVNKNNLTLIVTVEGSSQFINVDTPYVFKEKVPTKFRGMDDWARYWYKMYKIRRDSEQRNDIKDVNRSEEEV